MQQALPSKMTPALIAGASFGLASGIPIVGMGNCICCAWAIGGGVLGAFLWLKNASPSASPPYGDGIVLGLLTGAIGAVVSSIVGLPFALLGAASGFGDLSQIQDMMGDEEIPPALANFLESMGSAGIGIGSVLIGLVFSLILYPIFCSVGALIGTSLFHKKGATPSQQTPYVPPAAPPSPPAPPAPPTT